MSRSLTFLGNKNFFSGKTANVQIIIRNKLNQRLNLEFGNLRIKKIAEYNNIYKSSFNDRKPVIALDHFKTFAQSLARQRLL